MDQARFLITWFRGLSEATLAGLPPLSELAKQIELRAIRHRFSACEQYARPGSRWFRESSSVFVMEGEHGKGLLLAGREVADGVCVRLLAHIRRAESDALGGLDLGPEFWLFRGSAAEVRAHWGHAARVSAHNLPGPRPVLLSLGKQPFVVLALAPGDTRPHTEPHSNPIGEWSYSELSIAPTEQEFLGLDQALRLRGLSLERGFPAAFWLSPTGELCLSPHARLVQRSESKSGPETKRARRESRQKLFRAWPHFQGPLARPLVNTTLHGLASLAAITPFQKGVLANLEVVYPGPENQARRKRIAAHVRHHMARLAGEWGRLGRGESERGWLESRVQLDDSVALFDEQLARGKGVLIVTPHLGNWELLAPKLVARGCRGAVVGRRRMRDPGGALLEHMRTPWGFDTLPQDGSPREILRRLRDGQVIGVLPDLEVPRLAGTRLPFLGRDALVMTAPAALARAAKVPLLPAVCALDESPEKGPNPSKPYTIRFSAPIERSPKHDNIVATAAWVQVFEEWIEAAPSQWIWYHDRWRTPPSSADSVPLASLRAAQRKSKP